MATDRAPPKPLALLLLPSQPSEASPKAFREAYEPTLNKAISTIQSVERGGSVLDIALLCGYASLGQASPKAKIYDESQHQLSMLYRVILHVLTQNNVDPHGGNDVDIRVVLVHESNELGVQENARSFSQGPVVSLIALAASQRQWTEVYAVESEPGEAFVQAFVRHRHSFQAHGRIAPFGIHRVTGGITLKSSSNQFHARVQAQGQKRHFSVAVGGTFDHLHAGHKLLLTASALVLESTTNPETPTQRTLTIGITGDELLKNKKYPELLETWDERQSAAFRFLHAILDLDTLVETVPSERILEDGPNGRAVIYKLVGNLIIRCVEISDPFGPTITDESISALVVSEETRSGGTAVNNKRSAKGWANLEIFEVDVLDADFKEETSVAERDDFQSKISSTEIRKRLKEESAETG